MRQFLFIAAVTLSLATMVQAAEPAAPPVQPPSPGGATAPAAQAAPTAAAPAVQIAPAQAGPQRVWIGTFTETGNLQPPSWVAKTIRQALLDELTGMRTISVIADQGAAKPQAAAVVEGKNAGADLVLIATCQTVDNEVRITGRVMDAASGRVMGAFKATGAQRDLFAIEDSLVAQVRRIVAPQEPSSTPQAVAQTYVAPRPETIRPGRFVGSELQQAMEDDRNYVDLTEAREEPPTPVYYPPAYNYTNYPPMGYSAYSPFGYGYGAGFPYYPSVIVINNRSSGRSHHDDGRHHDGDHHGDFDHRGGGGIRWSNGPGMRWAGGGGSRWSGAGRTQAVSGNGQAIRHEASFAGHVPVGVSMTVQNPPSMVIGGKR
jgi:TolB-like protein